MTAHAVMVDINGNLIAPANLLAANAIATTDQVGQVAADLADHESKTGTNVHGLGTMSIQGTGDYYNAAITDGLLAEKASTTSVAQVASDLSDHEGDTNNPHAVTPGQVGASLQDVLNEGNTATNAIEVGREGVTNIFMGSFRAGNNAREIEVNELGFSVVDADSTNVEFIVENLGGGNWRIDVKGNPITNGIWRGGASTLPDIDWNYVTNKIMSYDGTLYTITNNPSSANDVLKFIPANTTAHFAAESAVSYGTTDSTSYRGDWGANASNRIDALEVPYQTYSATVTPDAGGTCTVAYASGSLVRISVSTNITLTFDNTNYPTNGVNRVAVEIRSLTNSVAFATATITNATAPTISTSSWTSLFFRKSGADTLWTGRQ